MTRIRPLPAPLAEIPLVLSLERHAPPLSWNEVFGRDGPVEVEIGSGKGLYLLGASRQRPDSNFIGVERAGKWFHRSVERCHRAGPENLRLVQADAFDFLTRWVPPGSLHAVHVYFPDPWPKKRHARRRLLQPALYALIERALAAGGLFFLASDVQEYFAQAMTDIEAARAFTAVNWPSDAPDRLPTNYARKYEIEGRPLQFAKFRKGGAAEAAAAGEMLGSPPEEA